MKILYCTFAMTLSLSAMAQAIPKAVGFYSDGRLENALLLPGEGEGFKQIFPPMERGWGTGELISTITQSAAHMARLYPDRDRLMVEDLSAEQGGLIDGHGSHQNGLDADLQFFRIDQIEQRQFSDPMVVNGHVSPNFDYERNWELLKALHSYGKVQRIFIDIVLKQGLCEYARSKGELKSAAHVLRSLRHEENHQDHLHVRIRCPLNSPQCRNQGDVAPGTGCP